MAMIIAGSVVATTMKDSTNMGRAAKSVGRVGKDLGCAVYDIGQTIWQRDVKHLSSFGWNVVKAPLHGVDAIVYTVAAIIPYIPLGWTWAKIRGES